MARPNLGSPDALLRSRTFPDAVKEFVLAPVIKIMMSLPKYRPKPKNLLEGFEGCLKPGEMCLVLCALSPPLPSSPIRVSQPDSPMPTPDL